jgi:RNA polymerase sigma-70 factor, ECF subfamily
MHDGNNTETQEIDRVVREHLTPLRGYLASLGVRTDLVDDVAQDVFVIVVQSWSRYDASRPFRSWLFGIARNLVKQEFRRTQMDTRLREKLVAEALFESSEAEDDSNPLNREEVHSALQQCVKTLSDPIRQLIDLRYRDRMVSREIADMLNMKDSAIRMMLMRARNALLRCLKSRLEEAVQS